MPDQKDSLAAAVFSEMFMVEQLARGRMSKALPGDMTLSQFSVLNHLARSGTEKTPAQLAKSFHLTRGALTNTITRLERAGHVHIRPDWDDARRKFVAITKAGLAARDAALANIGPILSDVVEAVGEDRLRGALPAMRDIRRSLDAPTGGDDAP